MLVKVTVEQELPKPSILMHPLITHKKALVEQEHPRKRRLKKKIKEKVELIIVFKSIHRLTMLKEEKVGIKTVRQSKLIQAHITKRGKVKVGMMQIGS